jgi:hypothetical protein
MKYKISEYIYKNQRPVLVEVRTNYRHTSREKENKTYFMFVFLPHQGTTNGGNNRSNFGL